jgi:hypothetical protein
MKSFREINRRLFFCSDSSAFALSLFNAPLRVVLFSKFVGFSNWSRTGMFEFCVVQDAMEEVHFETTLKRNTDRRKREMGVYKMKLVVVACLAVLHKTRRDLDEKKETEDFEKKRFQINKTNLLNEVNNNQ